MKLEYFDEGFFRCLLCGKKKSIGFEPIPENEEREGFLLDRLLLPHLYKDEITGHVCYSCIFDFCQMFDITEVLVNEQRHSKLEAKLKGTEE